jgi:hypothetical protein
MQLVAIAQDAAAKTANLSLRKVADYASGFLRNSASSARFVEIEPVRSRLSHDSVSITLGVIAIKACRHSIEGRGQRLKQLCRSPSLN